MSSGLNSLTETEKQDTKKETKKFSSTCSTYVTLLGYSLALSDYWRFPFLAYRNGGGAFLIPFVITILVCGIPLYFLEYSAAKFSGKGPHAIWDVSPLFRGIGYSVCFANLLYMVGNTIMRCWLLDFLFNSFQDPLPWTQCNETWNTKACRDKTFQMGDGNNSMVLNINGSDVITKTGVNSNYLNSTTAVTVDTSGVGMSAAEEFWQKCVIPCTYRLLPQHQLCISLLISFVFARSSDTFRAALGYKVLELSSGILDLHPVQWRYMLTLFALRTVLFFCIIKSIKSIEKVMYVTTLIPIILTVAIFIRSLMLPGSVDGIYLFFYPEFSKLVEPRVWVEAALMAFYTMAFGWGAIVTLGSHAKFKENSVRTSILLPVIDAVMAMFSGLVCFSVLGNMATTYHIPVSEVVNAGMSTGIIAYVSALSTLPFPQVWSVLFFSSAILTSVDSQMVPLEMILQVVGEIFPNLFPKYRIHTLAAISVCAFLFALPTCTGAGAYIFLWNDWYSGAWVGPIVAFVELTVFSWTYGMDRFSCDISIMIGRPIPTLFRVFISFVSPCIVLVIFLTSCIEYIDPTYGSYIYPGWARFVGWMLVAAILLPLPLHAVVAIVRGEGSLLKRIKHELKPTDGWGPCEDDESAAYKQANTTYKVRTRSRKDLLFYNLFGRYPANSPTTTVSPHESEMAVIER